MLADGTDVQGDRGVKKKENILIIGFALVVLLVVALLFNNSIRRSSHIVLPNETSKTVTAQDEIKADTTGPVQIDVTPENVQAVIETLHRDDRYVLQSTVEYLWSGDRGALTSTVTVSNGFTRIDTKLPDNQMKHTITDESHTWIWYNQQTDVYSGASGDISADQEHYSPTYEDVLDLDVSEIMATSYCVFSDVNCISVETGTEGNIMRYWISVDSGLLVGAEMLEDEETVYRMAAYPLHGITPKTKDFTLPDGTILQEVLQ